MAGVCGRGTGPAARRLLLLAPLAASGEQLAAAPLAAVLEAVLVAGPARLAEAHESGAVAEAERHMQAWVERRLALALGKRVTVTRRAQALRLDPPSL